jgi:hypothetical protein
MKYTLILAGLGLLLGGVKPARADFMWTLTGSSVSGTVNFVKVTGGFEIKVINTESNTADASQAISQIQLTLGGGLGVPTSFTEIKGTATDFTNPTTSVDDTPASGVADHWKFSTSGSTVSIFDVNGPVGQPDHLIVAAGSTPNSSLTNTHLPSFIGETDFFFADATVPSAFTTSDVTGVKLAFGTQPETPLTGLTAPSSTVPEPATFYLLGGIAIAIVSRLRKRNATI